MSHAHRHTSGPEHDYEPQYGLPEALPAGEHLLWQGSPRFASLAVRSFHARKLAVYFALMVLARLASDAASGEPMAVALVTAAKFAVIGAVGLGLVLGIAWLTARTTVYTLTDKRVVMRIGIVLSVSYNLPLSRITAAGLRLHADGSGNLPLTLAVPNKIAYLHLWPHARPWQLSRPEPMLLCVPQAQHVAGLLSTAWSQVHGAAPVTAAVTPAAVPPRTSTEPAAGPSGQWVPTH